MIFSENRYPLFGIMLSAWGSMDEARFAIYFVPGADTALYRFGAAFIGYDCYTGEEYDPPDGTGLDLDDWNELTRAPRNYGFHATLKAPFHLAAATSEADLVAEFRQFTSAPRHVPTFDPVVRPLGQFIAIVPAAACPALDLLAADCVTAFDTFRRPLDAPERNKRVEAGSTERQIANLDRWGYPYVFEDFRFHMTLTGSLPPGRRNQILALLQARFSTAVGRAPQPVAQLALLRQDAPSARFRVICTAAITPKG
jgi:putative phosphonate metabolism protein